MHIHVVRCCQCINTYVDNFYSNAKVHPWSMWAMAAGRPIIHQYVFKIFTDCLVSIPLLSQNTQPSCISPQRLWTLEKTQSHRESQKLQGWKRPP